MKVNHGQKQETSIAIVYDTFPSKLLRCSFSIVKDKYKECKTVKIQQTNNSGLERYPVFSGIK